MSHLVETIFRQSDHYNGEKDAVFDAVKLKWYRHNEKLVPGFDYFLDRLHSENPSSLRADALPHLVAAYLDQFSEDVSQHVFKNRSVARVDSYDALLLSGGEKAFIVLVQAKTDQGLLPFVCSIARGPDGTKLGLGHYYDFQNIAVLSRLAEEKLRPEGQKLLKVITPFLLSPVNVDDDVYFVTSMPFIDDYAELTVDLHVKKDHFGQPLQMLYFRYALEYLPWIKAYNDQVNRSLMEFDQAVDKIVSLKKGAPLTEEDYIKIVQDQEAPKRYRRQLGDVLTAHALIYLITDGIIPHEFQINAGCFMGRDTDVGGFQLCLSSVRGGEFFKPKVAPGEDPWEMYWINHTEPIINTAFITHLLTGNIDLAEESLARAKTMVI